MYRTKQYLFNARSVLTLKEIERFKDTLKIGNTYELTKITTSKEPGKEGRRKLSCVRNMRLVKKYPFIATFEDENGFLESFGYWEVMKLTRGEEYI